MNDREGILRTLKNVGLMHASRADCNQCVVDQSRCWDEARLLMDETSPDHGVG